MTIILVILGGAWAVWEILRHNPKLTDKAIERIPEAEVIWEPLTTNDTWDHPLSCRCRLCRD